MNVYGKVIGVATLLFAVAVAQAGTINYKILVNGVDTDIVNLGDVPIDSFFDITIQVNVPDVDFGGGYYGGCLQYGINIGDSGSALTPEQGVGGPPLFLPDGKWKSTSTSPMTNYKGLVDTNGYDVFAQQGAIAPGDFGTYYDAFGAGPDIWSTVCTGKIKWNGEGTVLTIVPVALSAQLVYGLSGGAENPTAAYGDSVTFVPEPATMSLIGLGGLALLRRRRK